MNPKALIYKSSREVTKVLEAAADGYFENLQEEEDTIAAVKGQFLTDSQSVIAWFLNQEIILKAKQERLKELQEQLKHQQAFLDSVRHSLSTVMQEQGIQSIEADDGTFKASFRSSTAVEIYDESQLPEEFIRTKITTSPDKIGIKKAINANVSISGARLVTNKNLIIK